LKPAWWVSKSQELNLRGKNQLKGGKGGTKGKEKKHNEGREKNEEQFL